MRNKSVAVLDIRSSEVCAAIGERGVNNTFIVKTKYSCSFDGYADGELLDTKSFNSAVKQVIKNALSASGEDFSRFYVGIPGEFLKVKITDSEISFPSSQKIKDSHVYSVSEMAEPKEGNKGYSVIERSPVYYVLSDKRRVIDPVGSVTDSLKAKISWFLCKNSFAQSVVNAFKPFGQVRLKFVPSSLSQSCYLIDPRVRDTHAIIIDIGYISSNFSVAYGNGILFNQAFSVGVGHIAAFLMDELDIPFDVAMQIMSCINLNARGNLASVQELRHGDMVYNFSVATLREIICEGLDGICEMIEECRRAFTAKDLSGVPVYVTGECVRTIRGTVEYMSGRLGCAVEVVSPKVPYYDKPKFSSLFSLLDAALSDNENK